MGEMLEWWLSGGDWADVKQNRRIQDLEHSHAAQVAAVRTSLSRQTSALDSRVDRLERALLAFVELEDTRAALNEFADAAAARRFARDLANRLLGADAPAAAPTPPADLPGYWLSPAVRAVVADLYPGSGDPVALRAEARARDDERAELFDVCVGAIGAREREVAGEVPRWFPHGVDLVRAERAMATEVARGRFGDAARTALVARLAEVRDAHAVHEVAAFVVPDLAGRTQAPRAGGPQVGPDAVQAAAGLAELAALVAPADAPTAAARPPLRDDPLAELLAVLINEGAPGEAPVLHRMATIRTSLAGVGVPEPPPMQMVADPDGTVWAMLAGWLADRDTPSTHAVARAVLAPVIVHIAESLEQAASLVPPATRSLTVAGTTLVVGLDGAGDSAWHQQVERTVSDPPAWVRPAAGAGAALAVLCAVLGVAAAPGLWAVAVIAAAGAVGAWVWQARAATIARRDRASAVADAEHRIAAQVADLRGEHAAATERAAVARRTREAIGAAFATSAAEVPA